MQWICMGYLECHNGVQQKQEGAKTFSIHRDV